MKNRPTLQLTLLLLILLGTGIVSAATVFDEAVNGGLSSDGLNPTSITLSEGTNTIIASANGFPDARYFSIVVPENGQLTAINLTAHNENNNDKVSWFAVMEGAQFTENSTSPAPENLLGHSHIGQDHPTENSHALPYNVLPDMVAEALSEGTYSFRIQNWGSGVQFTFDYVLTLAPPSSVALSQTFTSAPVLPIMLLWVLLLLLTFSLSKAWRRR